MTRHLQNKVTSDDVSDKAKPVTLYFRKNSARDALILKWGKRRSMSMSDAFKEMLFAQVKSEFTDFASEIHGESPTVLKHMTASQLLALINEWNNTPPLKKLVKQATHKRERVESKQDEDEKREVKQNVKVHNCSQSDDDQPFYQPF